MAVTGISPDIGRRFRLEAEQEGLVVIAIAPASSAARAGIQVGDVIDEVNRQPIRTLEDFTKATTAAKDSDRPLLLTRRGNFSSYRVLRKRD